MEPTTLRTGEVAARAGVNVETLRFYERRGLLKEPKRRSSSGYRDYPPDAVRVVRFIKRAQELGFTLGEIEDLLRLRENEGSTCADIRAAAASKLRGIDGKILSLRRMKRALTLLVESCSADGSTRECPILEALDAPRRKP